MNNPGRSCLAVLAFSMIVSGCGPSGGGDSALWTAALEGPGGDVVFGLDLRGSGGSWEAWWVNGEQRIRVPQVEFDGTQLVLGMDEGDSEIRAVSHGVGDDRQLTGEWTSVGPDGQVTRMPFRATPGDPLSSESTTTVARGPGSGGTAFTLTVEKIHHPPRYQIDLASGGQPAVGIFDVEPSGVVQGTFLTPRAEYRHLAGKLGRPEAGDSLIMSVVLSSFDGQEACLFKHNVDSQWRLVDGQLWSGNSVHDTYTGTPDEHATMPGG